MFLQLSQDLFVLWLIHLDEYVVTDIFTGVMALPDDERAVGSTCHVDRLVLRQSLFVITASGKALPVLGLVVAVRP